MGYRQVVRHLVLVQTFGGSNPSTPESNVYIKFNKNVNVIKSTIKDHVKILTNFFAFL
jgi:hypothetical protein